MCTIGVVYTKNGVIAFKNRDLIGDRFNIPPNIGTGSQGEYIRFQAVEEEAFPGIWAGINRAGLFILGADGNAIEQHVGEQYGDGRKTWETYESVIANTTNTDEALHKIINDYNKIKVGETGDIILVGDRHKSVIIEYVYKRWSLQYIYPQEDVFGLRTNFFINMPHLRPAEASMSVHASSAKRYERAMSLLSGTGRESTIKDIKQLCSDHFWGKNAFSICRHGCREDYHTTGTAIFELSNNSTSKCHYVVNSNPCCNSYNLLELSDG